MELIEQLLTTRHGFAALASIGTAILILMSTLGGLAYLARRPARPVR